MNGRSLRLTAQGRLLLRLKGGSVGMTPRWRRLADSRFGNELAGLGWLDWELVVGCWDMVPLLLRQISQ